MGLGSKSLLYLKTTDTHWFVFAWGFLIAIVGVHFGGSLFAMTDPFFMIMVQHNLGKEYVVWDRAAKIDFVKPGRGNVHAEFSISEKQLEELKSAAQHGAKVLRDFTVEVKDRSNEVVAVIVKTIYVRQKRK